MNNKVKIVIFLLALALFAGCVKESRSTGPIAPPNLRPYQQDFRKIWFTLTRIITREFGLPLAVANIKQRYFATKTVLDSGDLVRTKYILSGNIKFDGQSNIVVLYRQIQVLDGKRWVSVISDYSLEQAILDRLSEKLEQR